MSSIRLKHASGNSMSLAAPGTNPASNLELKLPHTIGSANQLLKVDGSGQLGWATDNSGVSLSGSTNNTIATVTGANALQGESVLTFDGNDFQVRPAKANFIVAKAGLTVKANSDLHTSYDLIQLGAGGALASYSTATATADTQFIHNAYRSSGGAWQYRYADTAMRLRMNSPGGAFIFDSAASGSAGATVSFSEKLRITSDGFLLLGTSDSGFSSGYTNMTIGNTSTQNTGLTIASSSSNGYSRLHFADGTSGAARYAGWIVYDHSVDAIKFSTANSGSQKVSIDSSGRVLIGVSASYANASIDELQVGNNNSSNQAGITIGSTDECAIAFSDAGDARAGSITYNHGQDAMIFKTVGQNERLRIASDGNIEASGNLKTNNLSGRNRITNGDMRVSQRYGTTETTINVNAWHYILDRFKMYQNTDGQATVTQVTSGYAASNTGSGNALRIKVTSADTSLSGTQQLQLTQVIEGFNCEDLRFGTANAKSFTVSFSILATGASAGNVTGTYCVNATNFGNYDRAYVKEYTIDAIDVWKKVTLTFPGCTNGTWGTGNTGGIRLGWFFAGPTSQQGAANQWHTSYKGSTTNQKNGMGVVNNFYFIKDIQVEEGTIATSFEHRSYGEELARCQRYYEEAMISGQSYIGGANHVGIPAKYAVTKRAAATVSWTLDASGNMNGTSPNAIHRNRIDGAYAYQSAAGNGNYYYYYIYKADAEL